MNTFEEDLLAELANAAVRGNLTAVKDIIAQDADLARGGRTNDGDIVYPIEFAIHHGQVSVVDYFLQIGVRPRYDPLILAATYGQLGLVQLLLTKYRPPRAIVDIATKEAAKTMNLGVVRLLVESGGATLGSDTVIEIVRARGSPKAKKDMLDYVLKHVRVDKKLYDQIMRQPNVAARIAVRREYERMLAPHAKPAARSAPPPRRQSPSPSRK